jgi:hypothetical protein
MFISFATWEGETASDGRADDNNGPYAKALGTRLLEPAVTVRDMFENVRLDVLEMTLQRQEPMNLSRLQRRSSDIKHWFVESCAGSARCRRSARTRFASRSSSPMTMPEAETTPCRTHMPTA